MSEDQESGEEVYGLREGLLLRFFHTMLLLALFGLVLIVTGVGSI